MVTALKDRSRLSQKATAVPELQHGAHLEYASSLKECATFSRVVSMKQRRSNTTAGRRQQPGDSGDLDIATAVIDTELLDVFAEIEALLRSGREVQHELLRTRGVPQPTSPRERRAAAERAYKMISDMTSHSHALSQLLRDLVARTRELRQVVAAADDR
jgi:hypothetical protein